MSSILQIPFFTVPVCLGCEEWERKKVQPVSFDISFHFKNNPKAEISDDIKDTVCYEKVCKLVIIESQKQEYRLLEKLAANVYSKINEDLSPNTDLKVKVHKHNPPVESLKNGVYYTIESL